MPGRRKGKAFASDKQRRPLRRQASGARPKSLPLRRPLPKKVLDRLVPGLRRVVRARAPWLAPHRDDAIVAETLITLQQRRPAHGTLQAFANGVCRNKLREEERRRAKLKKREVAMHQQDEEGQFQPVEYADGTTPAPDARVSLRELLETLDAFRRGLNDKERMLFDLAFLGKPDNAVLAAALGISRGAAKVRLNRLRDKLRVILADFSPPLRNKTPKRPSDQRSGTDPGQPTGSAPDPAE